MPKALRAVLGTILLVGTIGLVTCQNVFVDDSVVHVESQKTEAD